MGGFGPPAAASPFESELVLGSLGAPSVGSLLPGRDYLRLFEVDLSAGWFYWYGVTTDDELDALAETWRDALFSALIAARAALGLEPGQWPEPADSAAADELHVYLQWGTPMRWLRHEGSAVFYVPFSVKTAHRGKVSPAIFGQAVESLEIASLGVSGRTVLAPPGLTSSPKPIEIPDLPDYTMLGMEVPDALTAPVLKVADFVEDLGKNLLLVGLLGLGVLIATAVIIKKS